MGMYDVINREQVKIFYTPIVSAYSRDGDSTVSFSGGSLASYEEGEDVPYKTFYYNYGKDFNIIDFFPSEHDEPLIHMIRDGKNIGIKVLNDLTDDDLVFDGYNDHGSKMDIHSVQQINEYIKAFSEMTEVRNSDLEHSASRAWFNYGRENKTDPDYKEKYKELYYQYRLEQIENDKKIKALKNECEKFFLPNDIKDEYERLGALITQLNAPRFDEMLSPNVEFVVIDDRLDFVCGYDEMNNLLQTPGLINDYFRAMEFDEKDIVLFKRSLNDIISKFEKLHETKYDYTQFSSQYIIRDIVNGRHKDLYLKHNLCPYEGFDYGDWDECIDEIIDNEYIDFNKELEDYVEQKLLEDNIEI